MRIILFRHGERVGDSLTKGGKRATKCMANQLKEFRIKCVFSSPTQRCLQTAKIIGDQLKLPKVEVREELTERMQLGHAPTSKEEQEWWDHYMDLDYRSILFETCFDFVARNAKVFEEIKEGYHQEDDILVVAHTATAYALLAYITKKQTGTIDWIRIGHSNYIVFEIEI